MRCRVAKGVTGWGVAEGLRVAGIGELMDVGERPGGHAPWKGTCPTKAISFSPCVPFDR